METPPLLPTREQLVHALYEAAELEHNLMCTYLYAAFSLKDETEVDTAEEAEAVKRWRRVILDVAIEEMGHLAAVWNITSAVGGAPREHRPDQARKGRPALCLRRQPPRGAVPGIGAAGVRGAGELRRHRARRTPGRARVRARPARPNRLTSGARGRASRTSLITDVTRPPRRPMVDFRLPFPGATRG